MDLFVFSVKQNERHVSALFLRVLSHCNISLHEGVNCPLLPLYQALTCWKISSKKQKYHETLTNENVVYLGPLWTLGTADTLCNCMLRIVIFPGVKGIHNSNVLFSPVSKTRISISTICSS